VPASTLIFSNLPLITCRKLLELEAQAALARENSWWQDAADPPQNLVTAATPAEFKHLITSAPESQLVVVDYLKPSCMGCRRIFPKIQQLAASNADVLFVKVRLFPNLHAAASDQRKTLTSGCILDSIHAACHPALVDP
jgi:thiol-disulfide isomerase/thioredoxin